jgi:hypothetical protein
MRAYFTFLDAKNYDIIWTRQAIAHTQHFLLGEHHRLDADTPPLSLEAPSFLGQISLISNLAETEQITVGYALSKAFSQLPFFSLYKQTSLVTGAEQTSSFFYERLQSIQTALMAHTPLAWRVVLGYQNTNLSKTISYLHHSERTRFLSDIVANLPTIPAIPDTLEHHPVAIATPTDNDFETFYQLIFESLTSEHRLSENSEKHPLDMLEQFCILGEGLLRRMTPFQLRSLKSRITLIKPNEQKLGHRFSPAHLADQLRHNSHDFISYLSHKPLLQDIMFTQASYFLRQQEGFPHVLHHILEQVAHEGYLTTRLERARLDTIESGSTPHEWIERLYLLALYGQPNARRRATL